MELLGIHTLKEGAVVAVGGKSPHREKRGKKKKSKPKKLSHKMS
jgi:hypothetical protein